MSGHSHYATTKRQKELKDNARGKVFSKLARAITIAAKAGGGTDPSANFKLRIAIDKARAVNMPKENIDRAISKAASGGEALDEVVYEGFGPAGILVMVVAATDNRNRTNAEIRNLFDKNGGKMGSPGSVSFNFEPTGFVFVNKEANVDEQILNLIDKGASDVVEVEDGLEVYMPQDKIEIFGGELIQKPTNPQSVPEDKKESVENFLNNFEEQEDVQEVYTNAVF
jgi:YebC/PmpR family DNA-binding regulatory protein